MTDDIYPTIRMTITVEARYNPDDLAQEAVKKIAERWLSVLDDNFGGYEEVTTVFLDEDGDPLNLQDRCTDMSAIYRLDADTIKEYLTESLHQGWDGWTEGAKDVLYQLMHDMAVYGSTKECSHV